jgi:hypothetical protein
VIVTFDDVEDKGLEPLMVFCINRAEGTFSMKFMEDLTREQVEAMARQLPRMMQRAIEMHLRLM